MSHPVLPTPQVAGTDVNIPIYSSMTSVANNWADGDLRFGDITSLVDINLSILNTALDPIGAIIGSAVDYLMNFLISHVKPLGDAVNYLLGDPPGITKTAQAWSAAGTALAESANRHAGYIGDTPSWTGGAAEAYKGVVKGTHEIYVAASGAATSVSGWIGVAGGIVAAFREFIWGMLKDFITQAVEAAILALAAAIPSFGSSIAAFTGWFSAKVAVIAGKFAKTLSRLMTKIGSLARKLGMSGRQFDVAAHQLSQLASRLGRGASGRFGRSGIDPSPKLPGNTKDQFNRNMPGYGTFNDWYKWAKRGSSAVDKGTTAAQSAHSDTPIQDLPAGY